MDDDATLVPAHPRLHLAALPTPLERMPRLEAALRDEGCARVPRLYLKRDDMLSLGLGGNKVRNLEFSFGAAMAVGATDVVTAGRAQSNHCRLTAAACARAGMTAHLVLSGDEPARNTGNLLLDRLLGARIYFTSSDDRGVREARVAEVVRQIEVRGGRAYVIPVGGSDVRGALGHTLAAAELARQMREIGEDVPAVVLATATGGTQAGMLAGFRKLGLAVPVYGIAVAKSADELAASVLRLANDVAAELAVERFEAADIDIDGSMLGGGYGVPSSDGVRAAEMLARCEGVVADPVYTGKGFAGLLAMIRGDRFEPESAVVFLHTGGWPAIFADLPETSL